MSNITYKEVDEWLEGKFIPETMEEQDTIVNMLKKRNEANQQGVSRCPIDYGSQCTRGRNH